MRLLLVEDFYGPYAWAELRRLLSGAVTVECFEPEVIQSVNSRVIAAATLSQLMKQFQRTPEPYDLAVSAGAASGPLAQASLRGLAARTVLINPPLDSLWGIPEVAQWVSQAADFDRLDDIVGAAQRFSSDTAAGRPGPALEAGLGPYATTERYREFLELMKQIMAETSCGQYIAGQAHRPRPPSGRLDHALARESRDDESFTK